MIYATIMNPEARMRIAWGDHVMRPGSGQFVGKSLYLRFEGEDEQLEELRLTYWATVTGVRHLPRSETVHGC